VIVRAFLVLDFAVFLVVLMGSLRGEK
jgi:hypothetical protein